MKRLIIILLCLVCRLVLSAEETVVVGDIVSAETGQAIANASVYYQGTKVGTTSTEEGTFALRVDMQGKHTLVVSAVGYRTRRFPIEAGTMAGLQVELNEQNAWVEEIVVRPGDNPAITLLQAVRQHQPENDRRMLGLAAPEHKVTELYVSDIQRKHLQRRLWQSMQSGMMGQVDSVRGDTTWMLPLYSSEHGALIMTETDYEALITDDGDLNFYDAQISLMGVSFLSPLARSGATYYQYYLRDSISAPSKTYLLDFRTKNPFYATLNGTLYIDSATYAITRVEAQVPQQASVNYLRGAQISQQFDEQHALVDEDIQCVLDFSVKTDRSRVFPCVVICHHLSDPRNYDSLSTVLRQSYDSLTTVFQPTMNPRNNVGSAMQSLDSVPAIRFARWMAYIFRTGYISTGTCVDIGHIQEILQVNHTEGVHVGLPFRTNERLWRHVSLEAAVGYGFRNRRPTGLGRVSVLVPAARRHLLVAEYQDKYVWPEADLLSGMRYANGIGYHTMDFTAYALEALYANQSARNTLVHKRELTVRMENDWTDNLETQLYARVGAYDFRYQTIGALVRLSWHERKVDQYMRRFYGQTYYPILYAQLEGGLWQQNDMRRLYSRIGLMLNQTIDLRLAGTLDYSLSAGCVFGQVPDLLLHHFAGNQGYAYDPYRLTLLNNGRYASRYYTDLHLCWNGHGVLFNLIPGIRYLRWRELATFKLAYGEAMGNTPYVEIGCGIGNIFRVLDLHSVWRLTNRDDRTTPVWAMRFRLNIGL